MAKKKKTLYLECTSGISGDMIVAALLDLGADEQKMREVLAGIKSDPFEIAVSRVRKSGVDCCDFDVILDEAHDGHDHDMSYLYGHLDGEEQRHGHEHGHDHGDHHHDDHDHSHGGHDHVHDHDHSHDHSHGGHHHHHHVGPAEVAQIIDGLDMTDGARKLAHRVFDILAKGEAKAHAVPLDEVHFHEVGAIDSIVDIVAGAVCYDDLGIEEVVIREICEGTGTVRCQHGILPVPVPAVANIAADCGLPMKITERRGELVTPTGAAFAAAVMTMGQLPDAFRIVKIGLGAGKRAYEIPSVVRAMIIEAVDDEESSSDALHDLVVEADGSDTVWKLECDIDDSTGEQLGYALERLYEQGAREVHYLPVVMKKSRPGWELVVICDKEKIEELEHTIFTETTTIGIRKSKMERSVLARKFDTVTTEFGEIKVKVVGEGGERRVHPEYESAAAAAKAAGVPLWKVYRAALV